LKTLKGYMLTNFKKIQGMYHATVVTDSGRCARLIVSERFGTSGAKKADYIKLFKVRYTHGVDVDYIRLEPESKVSGNVDIAFVNKVCAIVTCLFHLQSRWRINVSIVSWK
jgi:hypothetical protein